MKPETFMLDGESFLIIYRPTSHSADIIVEERLADKYDKFLLVQEGDNVTKIVGWCTKKELMSVPARDIFRNGISCYVVHDTNVHDLKSFKILKPKTYKAVLTINQQTAENLGASEMISGILAGLHYFTKQAGIFFRDINQKDECIIGDKKIKLYVRDIKMDEDMLVYESYYSRHPEIDIYILCKVKGSNYSYLGYTTREVIQDTRVVQMIGAESDKASESIRRIFAEQYMQMSDIIKIEDIQTKEEEKIDPPQSYVPLHVHSEFSVGDGYGKMQYMTSILRKKGFKACALTDHGTLAGVWEFQKACLEKGIKPIIGYEAYVTNGKEENNYHMTVLVKNAKGYENLLKLHAIAVRENFYYRPRVPLDALLEHHEGLIVTAGCMSGLIPTKLAKNFDTEAEEIFQKIYQAYGDDFYCEIMCHAIPGYQETMKKLWTLATAYKVKCIFTTDTHYPVADDKRIHDAVKAISRRVKYGEAGFDDDCFYFMQDADVEAKIQKCAQWQIPYFKEFLFNTNEVADKCDFKIEGTKGDTLPEAKVEKHIDEFKQWLVEGRSPDYCKNEADSYMVFMAYKGLNRINRASDKVYVDRLELELKRMITKSYTNYFLATAEMVNWAKDNGIRVGYGRGSVGSSLVSYCLNITEVDPIKYDLLFDRFISEIRRDAPDADVDYMDTRRDEVFQHLYDKYGENKCAKIVTYARFHSKGIMRDIGRIFSIPIREVEKINNLAISRSGGDARAELSLTDTFEEFAEAKEFKQKYPKETDIACRLEGHVRHCSVHAAAMVLGKENIHDYVPIRKVGGIVVTEWEKQMVEDAGLVKFDILGLRTLSIIDDCVKSAGIELPTDFEDKNVYEKIFHHDNNMYGIFQFSETGMQKYASSLKPDCFNDLYDCSTNFRPGSLHCVDAKTFVSISDGAKHIEQLFNEQSEGKQVLVKNRFGQINKAKIHNNGMQKCFELIIDYGTSRKNGRKIIATDKHKFLTKDGWKEMKDLKVGDEIFTVKIIRGFKKGHKVWNFGKRKIDFPDRKWGGWQKGQTPWNKGRKMDFSAETRKMFGNRLREIGINTRFKKGNVPHNKGNIGWATRMHIKYPESHPNYVLGKNGRVSYMQKKLYKEVKKVFLDAVINLSVKTKHSYRFPDVGVPSIKTDFEFDGEHWHKNKENDKKRDEELLEVGWKTVRINQDNFDKFVERLQNGAYQSQN